MTVKNARLQSSPIPVEAVAAYPAPGMAIPAGIQFSPDDRRISYLRSPDQSLTHLLYAFDPQDGQERLLAEPPGNGTTEENVSLVEALRRERQRQLTTGITQYTWGAHSNLLLLPIKGDLYLQKEGENRLRRVLDSQGAPALDARLSPDDQWIAYVQDMELFILPVEGGVPVQLTRGARGTGKTHGLAEFIAQEEMGRRQGYWWSPDSQRIAFTEVDETHIPVYRIVHQGKDDTGETAQEDHHYPFAGKINASVRLGVVGREGGEPLWLDLGVEEDIYLARVNWFSDDTLAVQIENREQTRLEIWLYHLPDGNKSLLLEESTEVWINLHDMFRPLKRLDGQADGGFIWASERSGFRHLYLYDRRGNLIRQLTSGEWMVDSLEGVDEDNQLIYFTASKKTPLESHLYCAPLAGGEARQITGEPGMHSVVLDHGCRRFVDVCSALNHPPVVTLRALGDGQLLEVIFAEVDPQIEDLGMRPPEIVQLHNRDGVLLYGAVFRPDATIFGPGPYPAAVYVYGGPHVQLVANQWNLSASMRAQYLRSLGFLVFVLDNRGSARRGLDFEGAIYHRMGQLEVKDQVDGVRWLVEQGLADPERVGIYGWSGGGYMAAMCLAQAPETFKAAMAGAPVTHQDGYDTHYMERYMGTPQNNPEGYELGSVMHYVQNITGRLLLVHGLIDENVHFRHSARLINALIQARKRYELLLFPDERHSFRKLEDRIYLEECVRDFFIDALS